MGRKPGRAESYLPHLWALCALVSILCAAATVKLASSTGADLDGALAPPAIGAILFALLAVLMVPGRGESG